MMTEEKMTAQYELLQRNEPPGTQILHERFGDTVQKKRSRSPAVRTRQYYLTDGLLKSPLV
jgi:hypothetical protein